MYRGANTEALVLNLIILIIQIVVLLIMYLIRVVALTPKVAVMGFVGNPVFTCRVIKSQILTVRIRNSIILITRVN